MDGDAVYAERAGEEEGRRQGKRQKVETRVCVNRASIGSASANSPFTQRTIS